MCWLHKIKSTSFFVIVLLFVPRRERTKLVYSMYSRMSGETVKRNLMKLGVDFFVLEDSWCTRRTRYLDIINALSLNSSHLYCWHLSDVLTLRELRFWFSLKHLTKSLSSDFWFLSPSFFLPRLFAQARVQHAGDLGHRGPPKCR